MTEARIDNFSDLHRQFANCLGNRRWLFRGQSDVSWPLVPRFGRKEYATMPWSETFNAWKRRAAEFVRYEAEDDWDWMAIAQHHGMATKLMDWSYNPLVACYFATFPFEDADCAVYAYLSDRNIDTAKDAPEDTKGVIRLRPRGVAARIIRQSGIFTYHNPADLDLGEHLQKSGALHRIIIVKEYREQLIYELDHYGFNRVNLFPDLDGLASYQNWAIHVSTQDGWTKLRTAAQARHA